MSPTLKHVAERAGVSTATVSRVLSGARVVSPELVHRIESAIEELGYSGNAIARSLRRSRTETIGLVVPDILHPFFSGLVEKFDHALARNNWQMLLCNAQSNPAVEAKCIDSLIDRRVDAIIIAATSEIGSAPAIRIASERVPVLQVDRYAVGTDTDWVGVDDEHGQSLVVDHLCELGVPNSAFVSSAPTDSSAELRRAGFLKYAEQKRILVEPQWIQLGTRSVEWGFVAGRRILAQHPHPRAIVCADDFIALGVLKACGEGRVAVPGDIAVIGFGDITFAALSTPPLTTVNQPLADIAIEGVRMLIRSLDTAVDYKRPSKRMAIEARLVVRESSLQVVKSDT